MTVMKGLFTLIKLSRVYRPRWEMNVHDHHSGFEARCKQDSVLAVEGLPDDPEIVIALDHLAQKLPNAWMVIDEENLYWLGLRRLAVFVDHAGARCQRLEESLVMHPVLREDWIRSKAHQGRVPGVASDHHTSGVRKSGR